MALAPRIYAEELESLGNGRGIWFPEYPKTGLEIGDVGYIDDDGCFKRIYNVTESNAGVDPKDEDAIPAPSDFKPLKIRSVLKDAKQHYFNPGVITSKSVKKMTVGGNVGGGSFVVAAQASGSYSCSRERGAMVLLNYTSHRERLQSNRVCQEYMFKHHENWHKAINDADLTIKKEDLIFVSGHIKTYDWAVASFVAKGNEHRVDISGGDPMGLANAGLSISVAASSSTSIISRSGPKASDDNTGRNSPRPSFTTQRSSHYGHSPQPSINIISPSTEYLSPTSSRIDPSTSYEPPASPQLPPIGRSADQTIFLSYYKIRYRLGFLKSLRASGGPHQLPPGPGPSFTGGSITLTPDIQQNPKPVEYDDPRDAVLDYILSRNPEAKAAIASDADIEYILGNNEWPDNLREFIEYEMPTITVYESGLGAISIDEAIRKAQTKRLTDTREQGVDLLDPSRPAEENPMDDAGDGGDEGGDDDDEGGNDDGAGGSGTGRGSGGDSMAVDIPEDRGYQRKVGDGSTAEFPHVVLYDHTAEGGAVYSISVSPNGKFVCTGFEDSVARVWDKSSGALLYRLRNHEDTICASAFSPDSKCLALGSADYTVSIWDIENGGLKKNVLEEHEGDVWSVAYSPDGKILATGSLDCTIMLWDPETGEKQKTLTGHSAVVQSLCFSPDGKKLLSGADTAARIWDVETGDFLVSLDGHISVIWSMSFSKDGTRVITGSEDHTGRIWDATTGETLVVLHEHTGPVWAVGFSPDDKQIFSASYDSTVSVCDSFTAEQKYLLKEQPSIVTSAQYSPDGQFIVSGHADGTVKIWFMEDGTLFRAFSGHSDKVKTVTFTLDGMSVVSSSDDGTARVWDLLDAFRLWAGDFIPKPELPPPIAGGSGMTLDDHDDD